MPPAVAFTDHSECDALTSLVQTDAANQLGARFRSLKRGQSLWLSEAPFDRIYRLETGHLSIVGADETGRELLLRTIVAGEWFGEYCLCPGQRMPHPDLEARADEDCRLVELRHDRWLRELSGNTAAIREFVTRACLRLAHADRRLIMMARRSADERIGLVLLEHAGGDTGSSQRGLCTVTRTHAEIARDAAMTRPNVSVTLGRFRRRGLIKYHRHEAIVVDVERLRAHLERLDARSSRKAKRKL